MTDKPNVPYRSMPLGYQGIWLLLMAILISVQTVNHYGWPLSDGIIGEAIAEIVLGAYLWGWIFWKFWLHKQFPKK